MTKRKKGLIIACACACVLAAGAGIGFAPAQHDAYALEEPINYWKEIPQINSWVWGSFSLEKNGFSALPAENYNGEVTFTFSNGNEPNGKPSLILKEWVENGEISYYFMDDPLGTGKQIQLTDEALKREMNSLNAGDYTMEVLADPDADYTHYAAIRFSVEKAANYWAEVPYIESWYVREWTEAAEFPMPAATAAYGDLIEYTIYSANGAGEIDRNNLLFEGSNSSDFVLGEEYRLKLITAPAGTYFLVAHVDGTDNYNELESVIPFRIFPSDSSLAALHAAQAEAKEEVARFIEWDNPFAANLNVELTNPRVEADLRNIESAKTVFDVQEYVAKAKLTVSQIYAREKIEEEAANIGEEIGGDAWLKEELRSIDDAKDILTVKNNLEIALRNIYSKRVEGEEKKAQIELAKYASDLGVEGYESVDFSQATTIERVAELLAEKKHEVDLEALKSIASLAEYKERTIQALLNYANYIGFDYKNGNDLLHAADINNAASAAEVDAAYEKVKKDIDDEFVKSKLQFLLNLQTLAQGYAEKYPLSKDTLNVIISLEPNSLNGTARDEMLPGDSAKETVFTMTKAQEVYEKYYNQIKEKVFPFAQAKALIDLNEAADEANVPSFNREPHRLAILAAETVDEVEEALELAKFQLGNELYTARTEMVRELDAFAADYFTGENYIILLNALNEGKNTIYTATSLSGIYSAGSTSKLLFLRAFVNFELDRYGVFYGDFEIGSIIQKQRAKVTENSSSQSALLNLLVETKNEIFTAARDIGAAIGLASRSKDFPNFDYSEDLGAIRVTQNLDELYAVYAAALARLNELQDAVSLARNTLELYAEGYGLKVTVGSDAAKAIDGIYAAATPDDLPELVKAAKAGIDAAAEKEQKRINGVNGGLIAGMVIFAVAAVGFAVLLVLLWRKKKAPQKKAAEAAHEAKPVSERKEDSGEDKQNPTL